MLRLHRADAVLIVIDVQERLIPVIDGHEEVARNIERLVRGCKVLDIPALLTEQYVKGLGATIPSIEQAFEETSGYQPIEKNCFSGYGCAEFVTALRLLQKKQAVVAGIETHVCVYQTVVDLLANGYQVTIVADAISSPNPVDWLARATRISRLERTSRSASLKAGLRVTPIVTVASSSRCSIAMLTSPTWPTSLTTSASSYSAPRSTLRPSKRFTTLTCGTARSPPATSPTSR